MLRTYNGMKRKVSRASARSAADWACSAVCPRSGHVQSSTMCAADSASPASSSGTMPDRRHAAPGSGSPVYAAAARATATSAVPMTRAANSARGERRTRSRRSLIATSTWSRAVDPVYDRDLEFVPLCHGALSRKPPMPRARDGTPVCSRAYSMPPDARTAYAPFVGGHHLAQINLARLRAPLDSPQLTAFVAALKPVNALADSAPGFVWRLQTDEGDATAIRAFDDDMLIVNMSVWESMDALQGFVYRNAAHRDIMRRRNEFFDRPETYLVLWWIAAGTLPTVDEAKERVELLRAGGPSPAAFTFRQPFEPVS